MSVPDSRRRLSSSALKLAAIAVLCVGGANSAAAANDCSLNGIYGGRKCDCDAPWTGPRCETISTALAAPGGMYGVSPNVSSWGGSVLRANDGKFHLWAAQMKHGGLVGWATNSECIHATSTNISGPYSFAEIAVPVWCHGPQVVRQPGGALLMVHTQKPFMHHAATVDGPWLPAKTNPGACGMPCQVGVDVKVILTPPCIFCLENH